MTSEFLILLVVFLVVLLALAPGLGRYMRLAVEDGQWRFTAWGRPVEKGLYKLAGVDAKAEMSWKHYAVALLIFNALGALVVYLLQRWQAELPFNPTGMGAITPDSSLNTAVSFASNTNWQGYAGESTMSYLTQMVGLTVQNFVSAATGIAVLFALIRGFVRHSAATVGNFWTDLVRSTLYILLPLSFVLALVFVSQGVIQNTLPNQTTQLVEAVEGSTPALDAQGQPQVDAAGKPVMQAVTATEQILPMGPVASQESIKMLGTNGGGFFNANSAHPYENPTALTNFLQMLAIFLIPAALCFTFGEMVGSRKQGISILAAMTILFAVFAITTANYEYKANPMVAQMAASGPGVTVPGATAPLHAVFEDGGNMEGKETRFGIAPTALFATITTAASCGAVNGMHDSFNAMGGFGPLLLMQLGEVVFGGVGTGLYGMLAFAILAVFIAGLMIGRTPEYLGKKIETFEMKMIAIVILVTPMLVLFGTALAVMLAAGKAGIFNPSTHGFSEVLYAVSSAANNNGSAFAGLSANTPFYNVLLAIAMAGGRYLPIVALLAIAGSLANKRRIPAGQGTMPTTGAMFVVLLIGAVLLVGALTYVPALALGPIAEQLQP
jgi:K+-transporting ATPase ATPase A chain